MPASQLPSSPREKESINNSGDLESQTKPQKTEPGLCLLEGGTLIRAVVALNVANGAAFVDLIGITVLLAEISKDLHAGNTIAWAATSQLVGATIGMAILGYLSDIWSRRRMLFIAQGILLISTLLTGLSRYVGSPAFFFVMRAFCGVATGSISNLVNVANNDFMTREKRNKYQGIQGSSIALGSIIGMLTGAALVKQWHILYFIECGLAAVSILGTYLYVPANCASPSRDKVWKALKSVDYLGILSGVAWVLPALVLICQYDNFDVKSAGFIILIIVIAISFVAFIVLGCMDRGVRPIVPFHLFRNQTIAAIFVQNVLFGSAYYSFTYFLPLSLEVVRHLPALTVAGIMCAYFVTHGFASTVSALIVNVLQRKKMRSYSYVFVFAFSMWTLALGLLGYQITITSLGNSIIGVVIILEIMVGLGTGSTFQNSVLAIRSQTTAEFNAVAVGTRNVLRFLGGAIGTAISATILRTTLNANLPDDLKHYADNAFAHPKFSNMGVEEAAIVQNAYVSATSWVFYVACIEVAICLLLCGLIKDVGHQKKAKAPVPIVVAPAQSRPDDVDESDEPEERYEKDEKDEKHHELSNFSSRTNSTF